MPVGNTVGEDPLFLRQFRYQHRLPRTANNLRELLGKHQHSSRVAQLVWGPGRCRKLADAVANCQPTVPGQDGWCTAADFELVPSCHRGGQAVMRAEMTEMKGFTVCHGRRAIGNPDAFAMKVHQAGSRMTRRFLGTSSGKQWPLSGVKAMYQTRWRPEDIWSPYGLWHRRLQCGWRGQAQ